MGTITGMTWLGYAFGVTDSTPSIPDDERWLHELPGAVGLVDPAGNFRTMTWTQNVRSTVDEYRQRGLRDGEKIGFWYGTGDDRVALIAMTIALRCGGRVLDGVVTKLETDLARLRSEPL